MDSVTKESAHLAMSVDFSCKGSKLSVSVRIPVFMLLLLLA